MDDMNNSMKQRNKDKDRNIEELRKKYERMETQENYELIQEENIELIEIEGKTTAELMAMIVQEINMSKIERKSLETRLTMKDKETEDLRRRLQEMEDREKKEMENRGRMQLETEERAEMLERRVGKIEEKIEGKIEEEITNIMNEKKESLQQEIEEKVKEAIRDSVEEARVTTRVEGEIRRQEEEIRELRRQAEVRMRRERRNNIVINGLANEDGSGNEAIENWLYRQLNFRVNVLRHWKMQGKKRNVEIVGVELGSCSQKREVMAKKSKLKEKREKVYIDMT